MARQYYSDHYIKRTQDAALDNDQMQQAKARESLRQSELREERRREEKAREALDFPEE